MAAVTHCYCLINNIPAKFHSSELRNFFAAFVEAEKFDCFHFRHRPQVNPVENSESSANQNGGESSRTSSSSHTPLQDTRKRMCGLVRFNSETIREEFVKSYNNKFWVDKDGHDVYGKCVISRIKLGPADLKKFSKELITPNFMPKGNVGTPNKHFLELIRTCRLPPSLIKKLGLDFPTARSFRKYSKVHFDYGTAIEDWQLEDPVVQTGNGVEVSSVAETRPRKAHAPSSSKESSKEENHKDSDDDDDTCEEWERHETFDDDVTRQERCKERLYEEEIELVWEKGGPGIVWWTDTQYWNQQKGGFDEITSDQLDVDMQGYFSGGDPDKDARDMMSMRHRERLEQGLDSVSVFKKPPVPEVPKRKHIALSSGTSLDKPITSEIGEKVMQKFGWKQGLGIGKRNQGIVDPVPHEGQHPLDKRGIGYYGEKLTFTKTKKPKVEDYDDEHRICIGTKYDRPADLDQHEPLLRRNAISFIKRYENPRNAGS